MSDFADYACDAAQSAIDLAYTTAKNLGDSALDSLSSMIFFIKDPPVAKHVPFRTAINQLTILLSFLL